MKDKDQMERGEGERLHAQREKNFWTISRRAASGRRHWWLHLAASSTALPTQAAMRWARLVKLAGAGGVIIAAVLTVYFSWRFFVSVDEVEVADNLWGSLIGFYVYAMLASRRGGRCAKLRPAPEPDHWLIYGISMIIGARRLRLPQVAAALTRFIIFKPRKSKE